MPRGGAQRAPDTAPSLTTKGGLLTAELAEGRILLMLDVPASRREAVAAIIARRHPEAIDRGDEPTVPAFP